MNQCHFLGNLTREPELKYLPTGVAVVNFGLAVNRRVKRTNGDVSEETAFLECEAWDSGAETINTHCKKGDSILIHSSVKTESWTNQSGEKRSRLKFRVNSFEFPRVKNRFHDSNKPHDRENTGVAEEENVEQEAGTPF